MQRKNILNQIKTQDQGSHREWLDGRLLIAMPSMKDERFAKAVIFICAHDAKGAMGLIVNKTVPDLSMSKLMKDLLIPVKDEAMMNKMAVLVGGPVETQRGFLLHSPEFSSSDTIKVRNNFAITGTVEALREAMSDQGPHEKIFALGYAGWTAGQLESELQNNNWLICEARSDLIYDDDQDSKWRKALAFMGIDPLMLSTAQGNA